METVAKKPTIMGIIFSTTLILWFCSAIILWWCAESHQNVFAGVGYEKISQQTGLVHHFLWEYYHEKISDRIDFGNVITGGELTLMCAVLFFALGGYFAGVLERWRERNIRAAGRIALTALWAMALLVPLAFNAFKAEFLIWLLRV